MLQVTGGEPTLHPDFHVISTIFKRKYKPQSLVLATNGAKVLSNLSTLNLYDEVHLTYYDQRSYENAPSNVMWTWLTEKCQMPKFVWIGVLLIMVAVAYQIFTAKNLLIDLNDRTLQVAHAEKEVAAKKEHLIRMSDATIEHLEKAKDETPHMEVREHFSAVQRTIHEDIKRPLLEKKIATKE